MKTLCFILSLALACVDDLLYPPIPSPNPNPSLPLFTQLLKTALCPSVRIRFSTTDFAPIPISTLAYFDTIQVDCEGNILKVMQTLRVEAGTVASFSECGFESEMREVIIEVEGKMGMNGCKVERLQAQGFEISGEMNITDSDFKGNKNSLFSLNKLGFSLSVANSRFQGNTSPQGTVLFLQPSSTRPNSTTWISFDNCEFTNNEASIVGSCLYVAVAYPNYLSPSQQQEIRMISITNSAFVNSPGFLWYLQLRSFNVSFINNSVQYAENPVFLALFDNSFLMKNTSFRYTHRPLFCNYVGGLVLIDELLIEGVENGPAIMILNQAPFGLGRVVLRNIEMTLVNQVDFSLYTSTLYVLAVPIDVENMLIHSGFSFAATCGAYFFSLSSVNNCTMTSITAVQGGLIGHVFGQGVAYNLNQTDCVTLTMCSILTMGARVSFRNITFSISDPRMIPTSKGIYTFIDSETNLTDVTTNVFALPGSSVILLYDGKYYLARMYWNIIYTTSFVMVALADVQIEDISAAQIDIKFFAIVSSNSSLLLRNVEMSKPTITGGLVSATGFCTVTVFNITINEGIVQSLAAAFYSLIRINNITMHGIQGGPLAYSYLSR